LNPLIAQNIVTVAMTDHETKNGQQQIDIKCLVSQFLIHIGKIDIEQGKQAPPKCLKKEIF
jgi:hypothetical protein